MQNEKEIKYFSTFSGIGGFELGIEQAYCRLVAERASPTSISKRQKAEHRSRADNPQASPTRSIDGQHYTYATCIGFSEIDKYAIQIYQRHFNHTNYGDITKINAETLPDFDLLVGGFPCQAFSIAGKRGGFQDTRGTLFFDLARILKAKRPRLFLFENVKGLLSHDEGRTFFTIISTLDELGYDVQWEVLNSKNFGVPQNRERVFIAGHLRGTPRPQVFPLGENSEPDIVLPTLTTRYWGGQANGGYIGNKSPQIEQLNQPKHSNNRLYGKNGLSPALNTAQGGNRQPKISDQSAIRRLTPTECERLQGYPDGWTEGVSDTQRYKTLGNSVSVPVIESIAEKLLL